MKHTINLAFASGLRGEFGLDNGLPWGAPLQQDMAHFKNFTKNCVLVMGAKTFESLPTVLKDDGRYCVVIGRHHLKQPPKAKDGSLPHEYAATNGASLEWMLNEIARSYGQDVCVIGGAELVESTISIADNILYTAISRHDLSKMDCTVRLDKDKFKTKEFTDDDGTIYKVRESTSQRFNTANYTGVVRWLKPAIKKEPNWWE